MEKCLEECYKFKGINGERDLDIFSLPLIAQYRCLVWYGTANGSADFTPGGFAVDPDLIGRVIIIKSIRCIPYANGDNIDFFLDDGVNPVSQETIPDNAQLNRIFDNFGSGNTLRIRFNGGELPILNGAFYPSDLWIDNIFYKFPEKLESLTIRASFQVFNNINTGTTNSPKMRILIECYIL